MPGVRVLPGGRTPDGKELVLPRGLVREAALTAIVLPRVTEVAGPLRPPAPRRR